MVQDAAVRRSNWSREPRSNYLGLLTSQWLPICFQIAFTHYVYAHNGLAREHVPDGRALFAVRPHLLQSNLPQKLATLIPSYKTF